MLEVEGFILAGGASSRMGTDKARLRLGGLTFIEHVARALAAVTDHISLVVTRPEEGASGAHDLPAVTDIYQNRGALGGLHAALAHSRALWVAVVACDLPLVSGELLAHLAALRSQDFDAVVPVQRDGHLQPLCALYAREPCLKHAAYLLESGEMRPRALLRRVRTRLVAPQEVAALSGAERLLMNVNTPEDYRDARKHLEDDN